MQHLAETFQRLSQKTDKKAATRASAAKQSKEWQARYEACMTGGEQEQQAKLVESEHKIAEAIHGGSAAAASGPRSNLWLYVAIGGAVFLIGGALWLSRRKGK